MVSLNQVRYFLVAVIAVVIGGLLASCSAPQNTGSDTAPGTATALPVKVATAVIGDIGWRTVYVANVAAKHQVDLAPIDNGLIEELNVDIGDEVREGQVLAELSQGTLDAQLRQAQAMLLGAEAKLASVRADVEPNRTEAQARADAARVKLERLIEPSTKEIQAAVSLVDQSRAELESARIQLRQLELPTEAQLAAARSLVATSESKLSQSQVAVNQEITQQIASRGGELILWESLLRARLDLQENLALLRNLRQTFDLKLREPEIAAAQRIVEQNTKLIPSIISQIELDSVIPEHINDALWAESAAQAALEDAQAKLNELENPTQDSIDLAQNRVNVAQASLDAATAELNLLTNPPAADLADAEAELAAAGQALIHAQDEHVQYDIDAAQANVDQAHAEIQLVQQQLDDRRVRAPFDGLVSRRWLSPGAVVTPQTPIITLVSTELVVSLQVEEIRIKSLKIGDLVTFTSPALPASNIEMEIDRISPSGDSQEHTFSVQLRPTRDVHELKPGMSGEVLIETLHPAAVLIPKAALFYRDNLPAVFNVEDNQARLLNVAVGLGDTVSIEILAGVQPGDQVIVSGHEFLNDGALVVAEDPE